MASVTGIPERIRAYFGQERIDIGFIAECIGTTHNRAKIKLYKDTFDLIDVIRLSSAGVLKVGESRSEGLKTSERGI